MSDWASDEPEKQPEELDDLELQAEYTGEKFQESRTGVIQHERAIPLPMRVRQGTISPDALVLEGAEIPWADVKLICLGLVHHSLGQMEPPKTMVRQMFGKLMGKDDRAERKTSRFQEALLFDLYTNSNDAPYRLESVNLNYRSFLGADVAFISMHNFFRLAVRLARGASNARVNDAAALFYSRRRDQIRPHNAIYDFELDCQADLTSRYETLKKITELDLSRDSYTEEWGEEGKWERPEPEPETSADE